MAPSFRSARLSFAPFTLADAADVFACITPDVARFMRWEPPATFAAFLDRRRAVLEAADQPDRSFVIRRDDPPGCLGVASVEGVSVPIPEVGLWLRTDARGKGYGSETVQALLGWAATTLGCSGFDYPVAVENLPSRRIAERLGGRVIGERRGAKYDAVVYRIPVPASAVPPRR